MNPVAIPIGPRLHPSVRPSDSGGPGDPRRRALLGDPAIHDQIRRVAWRVGVPDQDADDVLHEVVQAAIVDAELPLDNRREAIRYLCVVARNRSISHGRQRIVRAGARVDPSMVASAVPNPEDVHLAHEVAEHGLSTLPRKFGWLVARLLHSDSEQDVAMEQNVSPGRVRAATAEVISKLRVFAVGSREIWLVVLFCFLGGSLLWTVRNRDGEKVSTKPPAPATSSAPSASPPQLSPTERALARRAEARQAFDRRQWKLCVDLLDEATTLDPDGDTPETRAMFEQAAQKYLISLKP